MKRCTRIGQTIFMGFLMLWICSCSSKPIMTIPPDYAYGEGGIRLHLKSDRGLNTYQGSPHALVLCTYQLRDPNAFNQLLEEKDGLSKLLECSRFDPSVTHSKRYIIYPDKEIT